MSNYNPRTFTSLGLLRSIPSALLHQFFTPYRGYLESQRFEWPTDPEKLDHKALHETLLKPAGPTPDKRLADAMFIIHEMADDAGVSALVDAIRETDPNFTKNKDVEAAVFVIQRWLIDPVLVENTNARRYARENRSFRSFRTSLDLPDGTLDDAALAKFRDEIAERLAPFYPRESIKLYQFPEKDSKTIRFLVRHGGPLVREGIVKADAPGESDSALFRREVFDVIVYDPENDEVRIHSKKRDADLYTRACGVHFVENEEAFPDTDKYTLEPLIQKGEQSLACAHVAGLRKITLVELDVFLGGNLSESIVYRSDNLFQSQRLKEQAFLTGRTLQAATFEIFFAKAKHSRTVKIQTPNKANFKRDNDGKLVEQWLRTTGFIIEPAAPEEATPATDAPALAEVS
ncbi:hypothetical protein ASA1KI_23430 [Opitutales bacterium ASA1]|uniref:hypothetical protein n=1 Tax=Congregicoccus parvus TaxID=3081749 RepID=UPI002B285BB6|nr:hypothetical protein ASA1KI_23430 [Opitutales bacterium ASA1]